MKKILPWSLLLVFVGLAACVYTSNDLKPNEKTTISVDVARSYFEQTAQALSLPLSVLPAPETRSTELPDILLTPAWSNAAVYRSGDTEIVSVPIESNSQLYISHHDCSDGHHHHHNDEAVLAESRLLVVKTGTSIRMFVTTIVPENSYRAKSLENMLYMHPANDFNGLVYFSQLDGANEQVWKYEDGVRTEQVVDGHGLSSKLYFSSLTRAGIECFVCGENECICKTCETCEETYANCACDPCPDCNQHMDDCVCKPKPDPKPCDMCGQLDCPGHPCDMCGQYNCPGHPRCQICSQYGCPGHQMCPVCKRDVYECGGHHICLICGKAIGYGCPGHTPPPPPAPRCPTCNLLLSNCPGHDYIPEYF